MKPKNNKFRGIFQFVTINHSNLIKTVTKLAKSFVVPTLSYNLLLLLATHHLPRRESLKIMVFMMHNIKSCMMHYYVFKRT